MNRAVFIASVGCVLAGLLGVGPAQANTYCAELPADASCTQNFTGTTTSVQAAVEAAGGNPGPDSVKVGPGTFVMPSPVFLDNVGPDNQLTLTGAGPSTVLKGSNPTDPEIQFHAPAGSSINSLTISIPDEETTPGKRGLVLTGDAPVANDLDVNFVANPPTGDKTTGVVLQDGATLKDSRVFLYNGNVNTAVASTGSETQTVRGSTLTAFRDVDHRNTNGTLEVTKSALIAIGAGGVNQGGTLNIRDSVIVNPYGNGDGIYTSSKGPLADTLVEGTTMLGTPGSKGAVVVASYGDPTPANTRFRLSNSVIYGHDYAILHQTFYAEDSLNLAVNSSAYDSTRVVAGLGLGTANLSVQGLVDLDGVDPKFKDLPNGDYSLAAGSPLLDAGQAADPPLGSTDFVGSIRACHGTAAGLIRRDIGAFEFKADPADDCTYSTASIAAPSGAATDTTRTFALTATKAGSTFLCSLDGAAFATCTSPYTASGLAAGSHELKVRARDAFGNVQQAATVRSFTVEAPTCATDARVCPAPGVPSLAPGPPAGEGQAVVAPTVAGARLSSSSIVAGKPATFSLTASAPGTVKIVISKATPGRRVAGVCKPQTAKNTSKKKCSFDKTVTTLTQAHGGGKVTVPFTGKVGKKKLAPGTYKATITTTGPSGLVSAPTVLRFKVKKR